MYGKFVIRGQGGRNLFPHVSGSLSSLPVSTMSSNTCTCTFEHSAQSASRRTSSFRNLTFLSGTPSSRTSRNFFNPLVESVNLSRVTVVSLKIFQDTHGGLRGFTQQVFLDRLEYHRIVCAHYIAFCLLFLQMQTSGTQLSVHNTIV